MVGQVSLYLFTPLIFICYSFYHLYLILPLLYLLMYKSWFLCNQTAKMCRQEVLLDKCVEAYRTNVHFMFSLHSQVTKWVVLLIRQNNTFCPPSKGSYIILESNNYNSCSLRYSTSPHYLGGQQPKLSTTPQPNLLLRKVNTTVTLIWSYRRRTPRLGTGGGAEK